MGFASGAVTFRRYRITRCRHKAVDDAFLDALNTHAFGRYGSAADDDVEIGWITPQHLFDVNFAAEKVAAGRFAHFVMRMDRNSAPASIRRSYLQIEQVAALEVAGRDYLTKEEKRQAKEAAAARAEKEARSGAFRRISAYPVLFDFDRRMLYFGNTSAKANDKLLRLVADTFDAVLEPVTAHNLAVHLAGANKQKRSLEDARPVHLVAPPADVDGDVYSLDPEDRGFLGREFLTWLWHHVDTAEGMIDLLGKADVAVSIAGVLHLKCDFNLSGAALIRADGPASLPESRLALAGGKQPTKMGLLLGARIGEWSLVLEGTRLDVSGLALPASEERDPLGRMEERLESIADFAEVLDSLFAMFVRRRLSAEWPQTLQVLTAWAAAGRAGAKATRVRRASA